MCFGKKHTSNILPRRANGVNTMPAEELGSLVFPDKIPFPLVCRCQSQIKMSLREEKNQ